MNHMSSSVSGQCPVDTDPERLAPSRIGLGRHSQIDRAPSKFNDRETHKRERPLAVTKSETVPQAQPKRLFLVDGMSHIFRAFYAIRNLTNSQGHPTNAVYGFAAMLRKLIRQHQPDYLAVIFDSGEPTFRHEAFQPYKANRTKMPDDLASQIPVIREFCAAMRIPILQMTRFEADDIIGTLARKAGQNHLETTVVSNDKDMFQLVNDSTRVLHQAKTDTLFDSAKVEEFFGVAPERVVDVLSLMGDSVDNVPGAPGIGEKGARDLVRRFGSLETLLTHSDQVRRKTYRESLQTHQQQILQSKELVTIDTDVPIDFSWETLEFRPPDLDRLRILLSELGFQSMLKEMEGGMTPAKTDPAHFQPLTSPVQVQQLVQQVRGAKSSFCWLDSDLEDFWCRKVNRLAVIAGDSGWTVHFDDRVGVRLEDLREFWEDPGIAKIFYDAKPAHLALRHHGLELQGLHGDAMLISYLLQPNRSNHRLNEMTFALLEEEAPSEAGARCAVIRRIFHHLQPQLETSRLESVYEDIDLPLVEVLAELEWNGIRIDSAALKRMSADFERTTEDLSKRIYEVAGAEFNLNSPKQLGEILFEKLNLPTPRRLKKSGQYSTSVEVLEQLAKDYEVPRLMLEYRRIAKLKSGYVDALPRLVNPRTQRVHPSFNQTIAATGRLSCSNPNLQNIPIRSELGTQIRSAFIASEGRQLLAADYSQIELRVLAHLSQDEVLTNAFQKNEDIHTRTACEVFDIDPLLQTSELRRRAKAINFGIIYGQTAFGLAKELQISNREAQEFIHRYFERYRGVKAFIDQIIQETRKSQLTRTIFGRRRQIPDINSRNPALRQFAERTAVNSPIQGAAADLIKLAMIRIHRKLRDRKLRSKMLLQVHDELVFEVPHEELEPMRNLVKQEMETVYSLSVPLVVEVGVGQNWMET